MDIYDGFFEILLKEKDGVYLKIYPSKNNGKKVDCKQIFDYLDEKGFEGYDKNNIKEVVFNLEDIVEIKISNDTNQSIDESVEVNISTDKLSAYIRFFPPVGSGKKISKDDVIQSLDAKNIIFGIDMSEIDKLMVSKDYYKDYLIAKGQSVKQGVNAEIEYNFNTSLDSKPKVNEDGSVDFHQLNLISNVKAGQVLAELFPEIEGEKGIDVFGNEVKPYKVKKLTLKYGKNVLLSEDQKQLIAEKDGYVKFDNGKVIVYDQYEIAADVDSSTGDIEFDGTVVVKGNVRTGFTIKAKGDIEIYGVVEGATLISEGQVILRRGIQGMGRGRIEAKGNLITKFIENSIVKVSGYIQSEAILHSNVIAKDEIIVNGKKGMLTGGEVRSGKEIRTKILGSHMGTITEVEVGIDPSIVDNYNALSKEIQDMRDEIKKMDQIIVLLKNRQLQQGVLDSEKIQMLQTATRNKIFLESKIGSKVKEFEELSEVIDNKNSGKIKISNVAYPGVRVTIGNVRYYLREELKYSTLYKDGADIKITSYS